ncbi:MAG: hypothetical protein GYB67_19400 [Chloroflexi bacterium]|nr:hypothetical protein [Chloroflexota bacterium]
MELLLIVRVLLRRWWLVLLPVIVVAVFSVPDLLRDGPSGPTRYAVQIDYSAVQSLDAIPRTEGDYQDIWRSSELTVDAFTRWVTGNLFAEEVAVVAQAALDNTPIDPAVLSIVGSNEGVVGRLDITWGDADQLAALAEAAVVVLQSRSQVYFAQLGGAPAEVTILSQSPVTPQPPDLPNRFAPFLRIGLGLLAGVGLALLAHYLDPAVRRRPDVEALGLTVIATIPRR